MSFIFQTILLYLSCVLFSLLLSPALAAPSPAPSPVNLESVLLAKLILLKGQFNKRLDNFIYRIDNNSNINDNNNYAGYLLGNYLGNEERAGR